MYTYIYVYSEPILAQNATSILKTSNHTHSKEKIEPIKSYLWQYQAVHWCG